MQPAGAIIIKKLSRGTPVMGAPVNKKATVDRGFMFLYYEKFNIESWAGPSCFAYQTQHACKLFYFCCCVPGLNILRCAVELSLIFNPFAFP